MKFNFGMRKSKFTNKDILYSVGRNLEKQKKENKNNTG